MHSNERLLVRTVIIVSYICTLRIGSPYNFRFRLF